MNRLASYRLKPRLAQGVQSVSIIVPMYNESESVAMLHERIMPVVRRLASTLKTQLILVDDGSTDHTSDLVRQHFGNEPDVEITLQLHGTNRGLGAALATGFRAATGDVVCTMDCDCTYDPADLPKMIDLLVASDADVVTGSPYHPMGAVEGCSAWRIGLSKLASSAYRFLTWQELHCFTSVFRAYRREWARPYLYSSPGFLSVAEMLGAIVLAGGRVVEFPATLRRRVYGESKMRIFRVGRTHLELMAKLIYVNLAAFVTKGDKLELYLRLCANPDSGVDPLTDLRTALGERIAEIHTK